MTALTVGAGKSTRTAAQSASSLIRNGNSGASNTLNNPKLAQFNGKSVPLDAHVPTNPFLNDFVDCIENLPNRLQILLTELRSLDVQVKGKLVSAFLLNLRHFIIFFFNFSSTS
jgi:hypothetical protein